MASIAKSVRELFSPRSKPLAQNQSSEARLDQALDQLIAAPVHVGPALTSAAAAPKANAIAIPTTRPRVLVKGTALQKSNVPLRRLARALQELRGTRQTTLWCEVNERDGNLMRWQVMFYFTEGTLAKELIRVNRKACEVHIDFPDDYPNTAPSVHVVQPKLGNILDGEAGVYGGALCLDFLHHWDPSLSEETVLAQVHLALSSASVTKTKAYTLREAKSGEAHIRRSHQAWSPTAKS